MMVGFVLDRSVGRLRDITEARVRRDLAADRDISSTRIRRARRASFANRSPAVSVSAPSDEAVDMRDMCPLMSVDVEERSDPDDSVRGVYGGRRGFVLSLRVPRLGWRDALAAPSMEGKDDCELESREREILGRRGGRWLIREAWSSSSTCATGKEAVRVSSDSTLSP